MKQLICLATVFALAINYIMAQEKQAFTLDDLVPGGKSFYANQPKTAFYEWWGETPVKLDTDSAQDLFSLADINRIISESGYSDIRVTSLLYATFPYADKPVAVINASNKVFYINWETKSVENCIEFNTNADNKDLSSKSRLLAFTDNYNLFVASDNKITQISNDGSNDIRYGESVHRNEFGIEKGTFWSPSGELLAFYRMDQTMVSTYPQVNISPSNNNSRCATLVPDKYPMAGETSHKVSIGIYDTRRQTTVYLKTEDTPDIYLTNIQWSPDNKQIYVIEVNRDQNHAKLVCYDASNGEKISTLFEETNPKYVEPMEPIHFLPWDSSKFIYLSRKDGYNHLYLYDTKGKEIKQLTRGKFEVIEFLGFNKEAKSVIFTSNQANLLQKNTYKVDLKGTRTLLDNGKGWHNAILSESGASFIDRYSSPEIAGNIDLRSTDKANDYKNLNTASEPWDKFNTPKIEVGTIKAADGKTDLFYRMVYPTDFDSTKTYPAILYVYGGPHIHLIDASRHWGVNGWSIWMAQQGYVVFTIDSRGSEHRGLDFEQVTFQRLGEEEMKDQIKGVDFLKSKPFVNKEQIGVHGWSFGGFMTINLMTTYPDIFKVGVSGGPVIDWKYYEVMYGERYMDTPQTNAQGYHDTSLINKAANLKGKLLIIYGGNDNICVPQHTLSFIEACIEANKYPDMFTYPSAGHNMRGNERIHLYNKITQYFNDYLK
ncbi:MAG: DPP IV N-terminal domain-containing protein [Bacteroidaceae bacterium]|nr:DPP IV N-terminal domain-containing protein [Bacteroidaceae bacterium]